jgi:hypothetical protein
MYGDEELMPPKGGAERGCMFVYREPSVDVIEGS